MLTLSHTVSLSHPPPLPILSSCLPCPFPLSFSLYPHLCLLCSPPTSTHSMLLSCSLTLFLPPSLPPAVLELSGPTPARSLENAVLLSGSASSREEHRRAVTTSDICCLSATVLMQHHLKRQIRMYYHFACFDYPTPTLSCEALLQMQGCSQDKAN